MVTNQTNPHVSISRNSICIDIGNMGPELRPFIATLQKTPHYFHAVKSNGMKLVLKNDTKKNANFYRAVNGFFMGRDVEVEKVGIWS